MYKWTSLKNLHFTLKFLGEVTPERVLELKESLSGCTAGFQTFELTLGGTGYFPNERHPNIVWIGADKGRNELSDLAKKVENACFGLGFPKESRPFQSHLTIARLPSGMDQDICPRINYIFTSTTEVSSFSLIESRLTAAGPIYRSLADVRLAGTGTPGAV